MADADNDSTEELSREEVLRIYRDFKRKFEEAGEELRRVRQRQDRTAKELEDAKKERDDEEKERDDAKRKVDDEALLKGERDWHRASNSNRISLNIDRVRAHDRTNAFLAARDMVEQALAVPEVAQLYVEQDLVGLSPDVVMNAEEVMKHFSNCPPKIFVENLPGDTKFATTKLTQCPEITINRKLVHVPLLRDDGGLSFRRLAFEIFIVIMHELNHFKVRFNGYVKISPTKFRPRREDLPTGPNAEDTKAESGFWTEMKMFGGLVFPFDTRAMLGGQAISHALRLQRGASESPADGMVVSDGWIYKLLVFI